MPYIGEIAALLTALCWAISVIYFRQLGSHFSPFNLNLWKGVIAITGLLLAIFVLDISFSSDLNDILWLLLSGAIGIGIGDSAFFAALNRMCERTTLLLTETLSPIFTALLAIVWLSEWLSGFQWLAIAIILLGVDLVIRSKKGKQREMDVSLSGLNYAALSALCQAVGAVTGRDVLINSDIHVVTASLYRLVGGLILVSLIMLLTKQAWLPHEFKKSQLWKILTLATFVGTFVAMQLQTLSFAHAPAAIVQALFASSIIFSLVIAVVRGQKVNRSAVVGSSIALLGVSLIFIW